MRCVKKETAQKVLKIFGIFRYITAAFCILGSLLFFGNVIPDLNTEIGKIFTDAGIDLGGLQPNVMLGIVCVLIAAGAILSGWALRRAENGKTSLALVLTVLSLVASVVSLFKAESFVSQLGTVAVEAFVLYSIFVVRKDA